MVQRNKELEYSLKEMLSIGGKGKQNKAQDDDVLLRAKELLFEKTKICKKLELQMEALNNQVVATKDALDITKSMLNLKNIENDHLQSRLEAMQSRVKCERDRTNLIEKKLNVSKQKETALTKEYELQRGIFKVCPIDSDLYHHLMNGLPKEVCFFYCHFTGFTQHIRRENQHSHQSSENAEGNPIKENDQANFADFDFVNMLFELF